jgi:hypothetical protein
VQFPTRHFSEEWRENGGEREVLSQFGTKSRSSVITVMRLMWQGKGSSALFVCVCEKAKLRQETMFFGRVPDFLLDLGQKMSRNNSVHVAICKAFT